MKYRKKPVVIDAFKYDGDLVDKSGNFKVPEWGEQAYKDGILFYGSLNGNEPPCELFVKTLEGNHHAKIGDYIIRGVKGELYPCKPDIFNMTYELAE